MDNKAKKGGKIIRVAVAVVLFMAVAEVGIRFTGLYSQLSEKNGKAFLSLFEPTHRGIYQNYAPFDTVHIHNTEFSYVHAMDAHGFRNNGPFTDSCAVMAFGDSFTEGLGAPQDSTWPAQLATLLHAPVYNAGVMGSDPVYAAKILADNPMGISPKKAVFVVNYSDIADLVVRGGNERFTAGGTVKYKDAPWFMPVYRYSHLFRALVHMVFRYDYMFNSPQNREAHIREAMNGLATTLEEADALCRQRGIRMYVFVHPVPQEYYKRLDGRLDFRAMDALVDTLRANGVQAVNLRPDFEQRLPTPDDWKKISWPLDGHFNGQGYRLMAECIAATLQKDTSTVY